MIKDCPIRRLPRKLSLLCFSVLDGTDFPKFFNYGYLRVTVWTADLPVEIEG